MQSAFLHLRLTPERANVYHQRLRVLVDDMIHEAPEPSGQVYSIFTDDVYILWLPAS